MTRMLLFAAGAVSMCACASQQGSLRAVSAHAEITRGSARGFTEVTVAAGEDRLVGMQPNGAVAFVAIKDADGCVSVHLRNGARRYCPVTTGEERIYHAIGAPSQFGVVASASHVAVESDFGTATLALSADPAFAPLRRNPELAAAAIAERFLPSKQKVMGLLPGTASEIFTALP